MVDLGAGYRIIKWIASGNKGIYPMDYIGYTASDLRPNYYASAHEVFTRAGFGGRGGSGRMCRSYQRTGGGKSSLP
jgi:hypothetical protein